MSLALRRFVMIFLLVASIATVSALQIRSESIRQESIERFINNRRQNRDYKALFDRSVTKTFTITFTQEAFDALILNMEEYFALYGTYRDNTMQPVDVAYSDSLGNSFTLKEVGFRTKSNTTRNLPMTTNWSGRKIWHQTSFQLQFDATLGYEPGTNEYEILRQREAFDLSQLNFEYASAYEGNYDNALITEAYAQGLLRAAGVVAQNASYGLVYLVVGGVTKGFGIYTFVEPIDKSFLNRHFKPDALNEFGDLYKATDVNDVKAYLNLPIGGRIGINQNALNVRYQFSLQNNTQDGQRTRHDHLENLIERLNDPAATQAEFLAILDVESLLRMLAIQFLIGNTDDFRFNGNNYCIYFEVYTNRAVLIPFDFDNSLGYGRSQDGTDRYTVDWDVFTTRDQANELVNRIFEFPSFSNRYLELLETFATTLFDYEPFASEVTALKDAYETILIEEDHLGAQVVDARNAAWYFEAKRDAVLVSIANHRNGQ
jgi:hypothetical protein